MFKIIESPTVCGIRSVIRFLTEKSAADIHRQLTEVYGLNAMSECVRKWVREFKDGCKNVHDEEHSSRPSVITDD